MSSRRGDPPAAVARAPGRRGQNPCRDWSFGPRKGTAGGSIGVKNKRIRPPVTKVQSRRIQGWDWGLTRPQSHQNIVFAAVSINGSQPDCGPIDTVISAGPWRRWALGSVAAAEWPPINNRRAEEHGLGGCNWAEPKPVRRATGKAVPPPAADADLQMAALPGAAGWDRGVAAGSRPGLDLARPAGFNRSPSRAPPWPQPGGGPSRCPQAPGGGPTAGGAATGAGPGRPAAPGIDPGTRGWNPAGGRPLDAQTAGGRLAPCRCRPARPGSPSDAADR